MERPRKKSKVMEAAKSDENIDTIMAEMEAATPKSTDKTQSFDLPEKDSPIVKKVADDIDASNYHDVDAKPQRSNFFSSILGITPPSASKPGLQYPSRPTNERYYDYTHNHLGVAIIFNQVKVKGEEERRGSEKDAYDLHKVLLELGFDVQVLTDFTTKQIKDILLALSKHDHSDNDCLLITIMTHGKKDGIIYSSDGEFSVNEIWENFTGTNCPSLVGKPKLFFIQACRGTMTDPGILFRPKPRARLRALADTVDAKSANEELFVIPVMADLLMMYSTAEGYYSFRNPADGSWFIQALCDELRENSNEELMTILTGVNRRVAFAKQSYVPHKSDFDACKQMPIIQSMLTKSLYFLNREQKEKMRRQTDV